MRSILHFACALVISAGFTQAAGAQNNEQKCLNNFKDICGNQDADVCFATQSNWDYTFPECEGYMQSAIEDARQAKADNSPNGGSYGGIVRSGAGKEFSRIDSLKEGQLVTLEEKTDVLLNGLPWFRISYIDPKTGVLKSGYQWGGILCSVDNRAGVHKQCPANWNLAVREDPIAPFHGNSDEDNEMLEAEAGKVLRDCIRQKTDQQKSISSCIGIYADDCLQRESNFTTLNMRGCINREFQVWDELLNNDYQQLMRSLATDDHREKVRKAQKLWISFSKSFCRLPVEINGGTMSHLTADRCMMEMTARQDIELRQLGASPEGN